MDRLNEIAGASDLWLGLTFFVLGEIVLIGIQSLLWTFRCRFELPEVPSCRRNDYETEEGIEMEVRRETDIVRRYSDPTGIGPYALPWYHCENAIDDPDSGIFLTYTEISLIYF